jgi:Domain of unknown function (DUF3303)
METQDPKLLDLWMANWSDLVNFEVHAVVTSKEAALIRSWDSPSAQIFRKIFFRHKNHNRIQQIATAPRE